MSDYVAIGGVGRGCMIPINTSQPSPTVGNSRWDTESYDRAPGGEAPTFRYHPLQSVGYGQGPQSAVKCYNCNGFGHKSRDCPLPPNPNQGRYNGGRDNRIDYPALGSSNSDGNVGTLKCHNCDNEGHFIRDCPERPRCYSCGKREHAPGECPGENRDRAARDKSVSPDIVVQEETPFHYDSKRSKPKQSHNTDPHTLDENQVSYFGFHNTDPHTLDENQDRNTVRINPPGATTFGGFAIGKGRGHFIWEPRCNTCGKRGHAPGECPGENRVLATRNESVSPDIVVQDETILFFDTSHYDSKRSKPKQSYNTDPHTLDETQYHNTVRISPPSATAFGGFPIGGHDQDFGVDPKWDNVRIESDNRHVVEESGEVDEERSHKPQTNRQTCHRCGQKGHKKYHCPVRKGDRAAGVTNKEDPISVDEETVNDSESGNNQRRYSCTECDRKCSAEEAWVASHPDWMAPRCFCCVIRNHAASAAVDTSDWTLLASSLESVADRNKCYENDLCALKESLKTDVIEQREWFRIMNDAAPIVLTTRAVDTVQTCRRLTDHVSASMEKMNEEFQTLRAEIDCMQVPRSLADLVVLDGKLREFHTRFERISETRRETTQRTNMAANSLAAGLECLSKAVEEEKGSGKAAVSTARDGTGDDNQRIDKK